MKQLLSPLIILLLASLAPAEAISPSSLHPMSQDTIAPDVARGSKATPESGDLGDSGSRTGREQVAATSPWSDWIAVFIALLALYFTIRESRRNGCAILSVTACRWETRMGRAVATDGMESLLILRVRNLGAPLSGFGAAIDFNSPEGGSFHIPFRIEPSPGPAVFMRGMEVECVMSNLRDASNLVCLDLLRSVRDQRTFVSFYAGGYLVHRRRVGGWVDRVAEVWNRFAYQINRRFDRRRLTPSGKPLLHPGEVCLPRVEVARHVADFVSSVNPHRPADASSSATNPPYGN